MKEVNIVFRIIRKLNIQHRKAVSFGKTYTKNLKSYKN